MLSNLESYDIFQCEEKKIVSFLTPRRSVMKNNSFAAILAAVTQNNNLLPS